MSAEQHFKGFPEGKMRLIPLPAPFFSELLPQIDSLVELKVCVQVFWLLDHLEGNFRYLLEEDFAQDTVFLKSLCGEAELALEALRDGLKRAVQRGTLLRAELALGENQQALYFLNSPRGRAAVQAIARGEWRRTGDVRRPLEIGEEPPNIYRLYEENIGLLTPLIADALRDAEQTYPLDWIEEAVQKAVENNARNWRYIEAILKRWQREGRHERKDRQDTEKDRRRYIEGDYADFIEH